MNQILKPGLDLKKQWWNVLKTFEHDTFMSFFPCAFHFETICFSPKGFNSSLLHPQPDYQELPLIHTVEGILQSVSYGMAPLHIELLSADLPKNNKNY